MNVFYTRHDGGLTLLLNGNHQVVPNDHPNFQKILQALKDKVYDKLEVLINLKQSIENLGTTTSGTSKFFINNGRFFYKTPEGEEEINGIIKDRILDALNSPDTVDRGNALIAYLDNVALNPRADIRSELFEYLSIGRTPFTPDGCFLAYKKVRNDYKDAYTGTFDNSPGKICRMPFDQVNKDRNQTCSTGLHFASLGYLSNYSGGNSERVVIVKINPKHVGAIPIDYQFQKGRCSEYYVVGEYHGNFNNEAFEDTFVNDENLQKAAPKIEFIKTGLKVSLEKLGESYLLIKNGKVMVAKVDDDYFVVRRHSDGTWYDVLGREQQEIKSMSFETKSVREAVKFAVAKLDDRVAKFNS